MKIIPLILAGGSGKRFWPLSREKKPKQSLALFSEKPMIVETYERLANFDEFAIVANGFLNQEFAKLLPNDVIFIDEPEPRNTAPAIALAVAKLFHQFGDFIVFIETADHYYKDPDEYIQEIKKVCAYAEQNDQIILVGIQPTEPHTGYGYIKQGQHVTDGFYTVESFKEKPDLQTAKLYLADGEYSWNSGMFISKASVLLAEIKKLLPNVQEILDQIIQHNFAATAIKGFFPQAQKISIDYGVMEKSSNIAVLPSKMHWDDIGDFNALARVRESDEDGNVSNTELHTLDSHGNIVIGDKMVALIGVDNLIVVQTEDVLFVGDRKESQNIKELLKKVDKKYY